MMWRVISATKDETNRVNKTAESEPLSDQQREAADLNSPIR
jgi:hypothetical protein